jgi:quercetin dioxygenase-like cupin family protein
LFAAPGYRSEAASHPGEEFIYVLSGSIRYVVDGQAIDLAAGDTLHFLSKDRHSVENVTDAVAEYLSIGTMNIFGDGDAEGRPREDMRPLSEGTN